MGQEPAASTLPVELVVLKILEVHPRFIIRNIYKKFWNFYTIPRVLNYAKNLTLTSLNMQRLSSTGDKACCISSSIHIMLQSSLLKLINSIFIPTCDNLVLHFLNSQ